MPARLRKDFIFVFSKKNEEEEKRKAERKNEEEEEKPVVEATSFTSEETHGGNEATNSIENSPNTSENGNESANISGGGNSQSSNEGGQQETSGESGGGMGVGGNSQSEGQETSGSASNEQAQSEGESAENNGSNGEEGGGEEEISETEGGETGGEESYGNEGEENIETGEVEGEEVEEQSYGNGEKNAIEHEFGEAESDSYISHLFYRLIETLADEEKSLTPVGYGNERYNTKKMMFMQYERKPLNSYKYFKNRQQVIVILDDSGSMEPYLSLLKSFLDVALKRKDVIVYIAPNGLFSRKIVGGRVVKEIDTDNMEEQEREKKEIMKSGLPVIYVGDFDGGNTPIELSHGTRVFWFAPEERYKYFEEHDWVSYSEDDFNGFFARTLKPEDFEEALKEFVRHINMKRYFYDKYDEDYFENQYEEA